MGPERDRPGRAGADAAPALLYVDSELRVRFASRRCHELLGHDPDTLHGRPLADLVDTATLRFARSHVAEVERGGAPPREYALRRKDGSKMRMQVSAAADRDAGGNSVGYVLRTEPDRRQRFSLPLDSAQASFWIWDLPTRTEHYSRGFKDLLGYAEADFPARFSFFAALHPEDRDGTAEALAAAIRGGGRFDRQFRLRSANGGWQCVRGIGQVAGAGGTRFQCVALDVPPPQRPELLAAANHALRTPLASVIGALELLRDGTRAAAGEAEPLLDIALENAERLAALVEQWLDMERIDAGTAPLQSAALELATVIDAALEQLGSMRAARVLLQRRVRSGLRVNADRARLQRLIAHLIGAALDRSPAGCFVRLQLDLRAGRAVLGIEDEGAPAAPGCDLGLLVAEAIVRRSGGELHAQPLGERGTAIVLALPCVRD